MKPVRMTHTEASMVLSNWWRAGERNENSDLFSLDEVIREDDRYYTLLGNSVVSVGPDGVAACILVVPERRRGR